MLGGIVAGLIIAWILSLFGVDIMFCDFIKETLSKEVSIATYYVLFAVIGMISGLFNRN